MIRSVVLCIAIFIIAALLAVLQATTPSYAVLTGPIRTTGHQRQVVSSATFGVQVRRVLRAKEVAYERFGRAVDLQSSGIWVVASVEAHAFKQTMPLRAATLIGASGRKYRQSRRAGEAPNVLSAKVIQPGLPTAGLIFFELPMDETKGMRLVFSEQYDPQLKDEIEILLDDEVVSPSDRLEIGKNGI
jgi:hypothetical protein